MIPDMQPCQPRGADRRALSMYGSPCKEALRAGQVLFGRYRVARELAAGGMGQLFEGLDESSGTAIVIKVPRSDLRSPCVNCARLAEEGQSAALFENDHLVRLLHRGTLQSGMPFLVMERLDGRDLGALIKACRPPLPSSVVTGYIRQACSGLAAMHAAGLVHRDLKPSNLFLCTRGPGAPSIKVIDFGLAKPAEGRVSNEELTGANTLVCSPSYASPEQIRQLTGVDRRTDVWSLGVVLFELLTGARPFRGSSVQDICAQILTAPVPDPRELRPEIDAQLAAVVRRCLAKERQDRYDSVLELSQALRPFDGSVQHLSRLATDAPKRDLPSAARRDRLDGACRPANLRSALRARLGVAALVLAAATLLAAFWNHRVVHGTASQRGPECALRGSTELPCGIPSGSGHAPQL